LWLIKLALNSGTKSRTASTSSHNLPVKEEKKVSYLSFIHSSIFNFNFATICCWGIW
jgi:hypothetical protein